MAFASLDDLVASLPGQIMAFTKASVVSVAGAYISLWASAGQPAAGVLAIGNTTTGVIPTDATTGAFTFVNPAGGVVSKVAKLTAATAVTGTLVLYDRVWHAGSYTSVNGTISASTTTQVSRPDNTGTGLELWAEISTALSATATTITVTYTDGAGTTSRTATATLPSSAIASRMFPFAMANSTGIRQITNIAGSAAPTGTFNLIIMQRLVEAPMTVIGAGPLLDFASCGFPTVTDDACLSMFMNTNTTSSGTLSGVFNIAQH